MKTANELKELTLKAREKDKEAKRKLALEFLANEEFNFILTSAANSGRDFAQIKIPDEYLPARPAIIAELRDNGFSVDWNAKNIAILRW